jgi:hypothetical protein
VSIRVYPGVELMRPRLALLAAILASLVSPIAAPAAIRPAIIGGTASSAADFPFMAALVDTGAASDYEGTFCGGTLIAPMLVVTAAHCTFGLDGTRLAPGDVAVVLGRTDLRMTTEGERIAVTGIDREPAFNDSTLLHDVAVLQLARPAAEAPTALVGPGEESLWAAGAPATIIGWGNTVAVGKSSYPAILQGVTLPVLADTACAAPAVYGAGYLSQTMICAGLLAGGKDSCDGDSGGPLLVPGPGGWRLAGITSWGGDVCAAKNRPGVYTRVAAERPFVTSLFPPRPPLVRATDRRDGTLHLEWTPRPGALPSGPVAVTLTAGGASRPVAVDPFATSLDLVGAPHDRALTVAVSIAGTDYGAVVGSITTRIYGRPSSTARPVVHGVRIGATARCTPGTWRGILPMAFAYRWLVDGRIVARRDTMRIAAARSGHRIVCEVVATSVDGSTTARSLVTRARRRR